MIQTTALRSLTRRDLIARGTQVTALLIAGPGFVAHAGGAWATEVKGLAPQTLASLIVLARDIYPHDRLNDSYYAVAVKGHDEKAATDPAHKTLIEGGIQGLDTLAQARGATGYAGLGWEADRTALLRQIADGAFFQTVRGGLVVSLYNQKAVWPHFGYEGASFDKGGYLENGFDDIAWL